LDSEEQSLINLTNSYRAQHGLGALSVSPALQQAAAWMATDMTTKSGFGHTDSLGREFYVRQADCGYAVPGGENIGAGSARVTGADAFDLFHNSAVHDAIMLSPEFHEIGVARASGGPYGWYWAVEFGPGGGSSAPAAPAATAAPPPPPPPPPSPAAPPPPPAAPALAAAEPVPAASEPVPAPQAVSVPAPSIEVAAAPGVVALRQGANLLSWNGGDVRVVDALSDAVNAISVVYAYDPWFGMWLQYSPSAPGYLQTLTTLRNGEQYWVITQVSGEFAIGQ
jgi:hypothetical protein